MTDKEAKELRQQRLATQLKKASVYSGLWENEAFQMWKTEAVDRRMEKLLHEAAEANMMTEEGKQLAYVNIIAYQELKSACEDIFKTWKQTETSVREKLKEYDKRPGHRVLAKGTV